MNLLTYIIICPLVFLAGFVDAVAGGGGLISLPAYIIAGIPVHNSIATNKLSSCMGTLLTTGKFAKDGLIPWKPALAGVIFAFAGSSLGAHIALILDARIFMTAMLFILPITAFYVTRKKSMAEKEPFPFQKTVLLSCTMAFVIGIYDGFYGPGTGTFLILLLMGVAHVRLKEAKRASRKLSTARQTLPRCFVFLANDVVLLSLGLVAGLFNMAGNYFGARYFEKGGTQNVKPVIIIVLTVFFAKVVYELFLR